MDRVRVGFLGTGRISDLHAIEYLANEHAEIVALCDADISIAAARAKAWRLDNAWTTDDYRALLSRGDVDLVDILLPHHLHAEIALAAFAAGKAVSLQKPMCVALEEADAVIDAAKAAGVAFRVFENFLFYPPIAKAKALVDDGAIGEPLTIRIKSNSGVGKGAWTVPDAARAWRQDRDKSGGGPLLFDDGHHKFAVAWHFMGLAEEVHAWIGQTVLSSGAVRDAPGMVSFRFPGNRFGNFEIVHSRDLEVITRHYAQDDRVEITGTEGVICVNQGHGRLGDVTPVVLYRDGQVTRYADMETGWESSFVLSTRHFIDVLRNGGTPRLTGEQGRDVLRFALAATESARVGHAVPV